MSSHIVAQNITKQYNKKIVLKNLSFDIKPSSIVGLIGPNGAGKSTLLRILTGLEDCEGHIRILQSDPWDNRVELLKRVSYVPDVNTLPPWITLQQLFEIVHTFYPNFSESEARVVLERLDIEEDMPIKQCSKGMKALIHLATMMSIESDILILDEPTLGLDPIAREWFFKNLMNSFKLKPRTIIISSHQIDELEPIISDILYLRKGELKVKSSIKDVLSKYFVLEVNTDSQSIEDIKGQNPLYEFYGMKRNRYIFLDSSNLKEILEPIGDIKRPTLNDLFKADILENFDE